MPDIHDQRALRNALGTFATGVTVVTTLDANGKPWGFTANSFTSVSLDPPLVLFCLAREAGSLPVFEASSNFAINILADQQADTSMLFASGDRDKFERVAWHAADSGCPLLADVSAWFDCSVHSIVDGGDHLIFIGRVTAFDATNAAPLGYCRGAYVPLALDHRMFQATGAGTSLSVSVIVEHNWSVLLQKDVDSGELRLPTAPNLGGASKPGSLLKMLADGGVHEPAMFVFSVLDDEAEHQVIYRTEIAEPMTPADASMAFYSLNELDWEALRDPVARQTLERYARERSDDSFGVYVGSGRHPSRQALR
ncbi:MAG: flavin reductase family protein [Gammaproteobacteria bacterium]